MKKTSSNRIHKHERGQAIVLIALAMVGLVMMAGLVTDTGVLLIEYGKLKRGVDAAAIAAAHQYSLPHDEITHDAFENAAINFLDINQLAGAYDISVHSCEETGADRPSVCNQDASKPLDNRKLVQVTASEDVHFGFLSIMGIKSTTITTSAVGEAATLDIVLVMDTSGSMAYETRTGGNDFNYDPDGVGVSENPEVCNQSTTNPCQPLDGVKQAALEFIKTLNPDYDRVGIVSLTGQVSNTWSSPADGYADRQPVKVLSLTNTYSDWKTAIEDLKVFQPHRCNDSLTFPMTPDPGSCIVMDATGTSFIGVKCQSYEALFSTGTYDFSPCPSSNVGGALRLARGVLSGTDRRLDSFWVALVLMSGPANATDVPTDAFGVADPLYPYGYCPSIEYYPSGGTTGQVYAYKKCTDGDATAATRHANPTNGTFTYNGSTITENIYDPDDYARDQADSLANLLSGTGVTIYTIGLGKEVETNNGKAVSSPPLAETLLQYIAQEAGRAEVNHGQYFYSPTYSQLTIIFKKIAENIATKISQ